MNTSLYTMAFCRYLVFFIIFELFAVRLYAQPHVIPFGNGQYLREEAAIHRKTSAVHTSVKPFLSDELTDAGALKGDTLSGGFQYNLPWHNGHLLTFRKNRFGLAVDPAVEGSIGAGNANGFVHTAYGVRVKGRTGPKLAFSAILRWDRGGFPGYMLRYIADNEVVPGLGYADSLGGDTYGNRVTRFNLSWSPSKYFNLQFGRGKHFLGDGHRSLLLSYNSNAYPFFKLTTRIWKIKYTNLFTGLYDIRGSGGDEELFGRKYAAFHYLSWNIADWINISLFEAIVWQGSDASGVRGFDINYLNPVIFYRPVEFSLGSPDNALMGMSFKIYTGQQHFIYGQVILDEFFFQEIRKWDGWSNNKQGVQAGWRVYNLFGNEGLQARTEFNFVRPYTFSHNNPLQSYTHFNEALAHPITANFIESVNMLELVKEKWSLQGKLIYAKYGTDTAGSHYGKNPFKPYPGDTRGNYTTQGVTTDMLFGQLLFTRLVNPAMNLRWEIGAVLRIESSSLQTTNDLFFTAGIKTTLPDNYSDY